MIIMKGKVTRIAQEARNVHVKGAKDEAEFRTERGDYYLTVNHLYSFNVGAEEPRSLKVGDPVNVIVSLDNSALTPQPANPQPVHPVQAAGEAVA